MPSDNVGRIGARDRAVAPFDGLRADHRRLVRGLQRARALSLDSTPAPPGRKRDVGGFPNAFGGFGWYFGDMAVHPTNPERIYCLGVSLVTSGDGGVSTSPTSRRLARRPPCHVVRSAQPRARVPGQRRRLLLGRPPAGRHGPSRLTCRSRSSTPAPSTPSNVRAHAGRHAGQQHAAHDRPAGSWSPILGGDGF